MRGRVFAALLLLGLLAYGQTEPVSVEEDRTPADGALRSTYILGEGDQVVIRLLHAAEISDKPFRVRPDGRFTLPMIGDVQAAGLTVAQLEAQLKASLDPYYVEPQVSVTITEFRSQPVSVAGAVMSPGVHQLQGHKTLIEMLTMAGGPRPDAGPIVRLTRQLSWGRIPLPNARDDQSSGFSMAEVSLADLLASKDPALNIPIRPNDVISITTGGVVYVIGEVKRSGGFPLGSRQNMSVLEALALAEGLQMKAAPKKARILRALEPGKSQRAEIPVNVANILAGKAADVPLQPSDILFIPNSVAKSAAIRTAEAAIQIGTGLLIWR
jgi:polysaccharide biosynthesis/export protein